MIYYFLLVLGAAALVLYIKEKLKAYSLKAVFLKSAVSVLFIAAGVYGWSASAQSDPMAPLVILGLVCGLSGDIWLDLKYVFPQKDEPFTYAGFAAFGIGHVLYTAGMLIRFFPRGRPLYIILPLLLALLLGAGNAALEKLMKLSFGKMRPVVIVYGILLFSTVLISGSLALFYGWQEKALNLMFAGGILFAVSDLILSGTYFGTGRDRPIDIILNYLTYYPAQFLIASSPLFLS